MMKNEDERLNSLLEKNVGEQMDSVNWGELRDGISRRLEQTQREELPTRRYRIAFKTAASVAAVVLVAIMIRFGVRGEEKSMVQLAANRSKVEITIEPVGRATKTVVCTGITNRQISLCEVEIIDVKNGFKNDSDRPTWVIISKPRRAVAIVDNGSDDEVELACLF